MKKALLVLAFVARLLFVLNTSAMSGWSIAPLGVSKITNSSGVVVSIPAALFGEGTVRTIQTSTNMVDWCDVVATFEEYSLSTNLFLEHPRMFFRTRMDMAPNVGIALVYTNVGTLQHFGSRYFVPVIFGWTLTNSGVNNVYVGRSGTFAKYSPSTNIMYLETSFNAPYPYDGSQDTTNYYVVMPFTVRTFFSACQAIDRSNDTSGNFTVIVTSLRYGVTNTNLTDNVIVPNPGMSFTAPFVP